MIDSIQLDCMRNIRAIVQAVDVILEKKCIDICKELYVHGIGQINL